MSLNRLKNPALKVAAIYACFSILWILFSDQILLWLVKDAESLTMVQMLKGWFFVLTTSVIIFFLLKNEISKINRAKENLIKEKAFTEKVINSMPGIFYASSEDHQLVILNRNLQELIGKSPEEINRDEFNLLDHIPDVEKMHFAEAVKHAQETGQNFSFEAHFVKADGSRIPMLYTASHIDFGDEKYFLGFGLDITERKKLQADLQQALKMEAIGTLAGGIAHDFNNILGAILGHAELAICDINDTKHLNEDLNEVLKGISRARELVKQILTFSRKNEQLLQPLKVQVVIEDAVKLLRSSIPTTIEIRQDINHDCAAVMADSTQIHQVIMNLCTNAYHAMRETGGILGISLKPVELKKEISDEKLKLSPGAFIKLEISDTGKGIPEEIQKRIFEPYYTTKTKGEGTGLGLAVVHGIVSSLNGDISVHSELNAGTTFRIYLPIVAEDLEITEKKVATVLPTGQENILVVDDDPAIAEITSRKLKKLGYKVTTMLSSIDTLKLFQDEPGNFELLLTDMTMPNMTGEELSKNILKIRPDMKILLCTGYSELINEDSAKAAGIAGYIMKPLSMDELAVTVRKILDGP